MPQDIDIALAVEGDAEWCARTMSATDPWVTLGRGYAVCLARCAHPEYTLLVAREGGERRGFVLLHPRGVAGSPYIASIAVAAEARGKGIGARLLDRAETQFAGAQFLFLCVTSFNRDARRLYERRGYVQVGELPDYSMVGASEILMMKRLGTA